MKLTPSESSALPTPLSSDPAAPATLSPQPTALANDSTEFNEGDSSDEEVGEDEGIEPSHSSNRNGKRPLVQKRPTNRRDQHLKDAKGLLESWRYTTWANCYSRQPWGTRAFMSDKILHNIALHRRISTIEELSEEGWNLVHARQHGHALLSALAEFDTAWQLRHEAEKLAKREASKAATVARNAAKAAKLKAEQAAAREARQNQPKTPRPSRSKKLQPTDTSATAPEIERPVLGSIVPPQLTQHNPLPTFSTPHPGDENMPLPSGSQTSASQGSVSYISRFTPLPPLSFYAQQSPS